MMKFYYDESEHSRKINERTVVQENYYDNFVTAIVGWDEEFEKEVEAKYLKFEEKYSGRKSKGELKSTTIKPGQIQYGIASLTRDNLDFVSDFLDIFDDKIQIYFSVNSKFEYIIDQLFQEYENDLFQDADALKYSIVKSIVVYQPECIINGIYNETENLVEIIKEFYRGRIEENKKNPNLKSAEASAYQDAFILLDKVNPDFHIEWDYHFSFHGFKSYLKKSQETEYSLFLDKEGGEQNTRNAAVDLGITSVEELDSKDSIGIRIADMLAGIISKLLKSINKDLRYKNYDDGTHKKLFSEGWFCLNESHLEIYKKLGRIMLRNSERSASTYRDDILCLESLVEYFSHFVSVEEIKQASFQDNQESLNEFCCKKLLNYYQFMHIKLPFDFIEKKDGDYFIDRRGAKTYYDAMNQPLLRIEQGSHKYHVLNVGVSKQFIPTIDIKENGLVSCYRIPEELTEWAMTNVGIASRGEKVFPSDVVFSRRGKKYFVDFVVEDNFNIPFSRVGEKVSRNSPCPCGSGRKYKKCCSN